MSESITITPESAKRMSANIDRWLAENHNTEERAMTELRSAKDWCVKVDSLLRNHPPDVALVRDIQRNALEAAVAFVRAACGVTCQCPKGIRKHFSDCHWNVCQEIADELETLIPLDPAPAGTKE